MFPTTPQQQQKQQQQLVAMLNRPPTQKLSYPFVTQSTPQKQQLHQQQPHQQQQHQQQPHKQQPVSQQVVQKQSSPQIYRQETDGQYMYYTQNPPKPTRLAPLINKGVTRDKSAHQATASVPLPVIAQIYSVPGKTSLQQRKIVIERLPKLPPPPPKSVNVDYSERSRKQAYNFQPQTQPQQQHQQQQQQKHASPPKILSVHRPRNKLAQKVAPELKLHRDLKYAGLAAKTRLTTINCMAVCCCPIRKRPIRRQPIKIRRSFAPICPH